MDFFKTTLANLIGERQRGENSNADGPKNINSVIWLLTINDIFTWGVYFIVTVLAGLYIAERLDVNAVETIGIGAGIGYFVRALVQVPIGLIGDKLATDKDEVWFLMLGNFLMGLPVLLLTQVTESWHYFMLQAVFGLGAALNIVDWRKLFAKSLTKGREGLSYAIYDTVMSLAIALLSILSGAIAGISGEYFDLVITSVGLLMISSNIWVLLIYMINKPALSAR
jgi:MFS family permease